MTETEAAMILKDLEQINKRMDRIDERIDKFIQESAKVAALQNDIKNMQSEQTRNRESIERAFREIEHMGKMIVDKEKIENAIKKIHDLELAPVKKNDAIVKTAEGWFKTAIGGLVIAVVSAFITWVVSSFIKR
jgi:predicted  nucleic acid-binding Zn-ribbon protein